MNTSKATLTYGLTHVAVYVTDVERTLRFYQAVFDMEVMYHEKEMIQLTTPGCHDILVFQQGPKDKAGKQSGIIHYGFRLRKAADINAMEVKISAAGGMIKDKGEFVPGSPYIFFNDPDGYEVEVWFE